MDGYPRFEPPSATPPASSRTPAVLIAVLILCVLGAFVVLGAIAWGLVSVADRASSGQSTVWSGAVPFVGQDPWVPSEEVKPGGFRYKLPKMGLGVTVPSRLEAVYLDYEKSDRAELSGYFNYESRSGSVGIHFYGLLVKPRSDANAEGAAGSFEYMFERDRTFSVVRFTRKPIVIDGKPALQIGGSYQYEGRPWYVEAAAFGHYGFQVVIGVDADKPAGLKESLQRILETFEFQNPESGSNPQTGDPP